MNNNIKCNDIFAAGMLLDNGRDATDFLRTYPIDDADEYERRKEECTERVQAVLYFFDEISALREEIKRLKGEAEKDATSDT